MKQRYDALVIGAGISGLTVANYLAQHGVDTALFEQCDHVGGYVSSFRRGRYTFDAGLTSFGSNGIVVPILQELGVGDQVELVPIKRRLITDHFQVRVDRSLGPLEAELARVFPDEIEGIHKYFRWLETTRQGLVQLCELPIMLGEWKGSLLGLMKFALKEYPFLQSLLSVRNETKQSIHRRYFLDPELRDILDHQGYPVMTATVLAGMWYSFVADYWYPLGGMQGLSNTLWEEYAKRGGDTFLQTTVERILVHGGEVAGVGLADGREVLAPAVFATVDLRRTFLDLLKGEYGGTVFLNKLCHAHPSESAFSLFIGLKGKGFGRSTYPLDASHNWFYITGDGQRKWEFAINIPTLEDPALTPDGESMIVTCFEEYDDWAADRNRGESYRAKKKERVETMLTLLRQVLPDLDDRLEVLDAASPLTYERYTGNYKGATAGWSWNPRYQPRFHWWREGHVPGLYCCGQWLQNPGGLPTAMLTARLAAKSFLNNLSDFR